MDRILIISGHDFRSPRKASLHFIAQELAKTASVQFLSIGFSILSLIKGDPRSELAGRANVARNENGVECFLWKTLVHPFNTKVRSLRGRVPISDITGRVFLSWRQAGCARRG